MKPQASELQMATSPHGSIPTANGQAWHDRYNKTNELTKPEVLHKLLAAGSTDVSDQDVYAKSTSGDNVTKYDVELNWQTIA